MNLDYKTIGTVGGEVALAAAVAYLYTRIKSQDETISQLQRENSLLSSYVLEELKKRDDEISKLKIDTSGLINTTLILQKRISDLSSNINSRPQYGIQYAESLPQHLGSRHRNQHAETRYDYIEHRQQLHAKPSTPHRTNHPHYNTGSSFAEQEPYSKHPDSQQSRTGFAVASTASATETPERQEYQRHHTDRARHQQQYMDYPGYQHEVSYAIPPSRAADVETPRTPSNTKPRDGRREEAARRAKEMYEQREREIEQMDMKPRSD